MRSMNSDLCAGETKMTKALNTIDNVQAFCITKKLEDPVFGSLRIRSCKIFVKKIVSQAPVSILNQELPWRSGFCIAKGCLNGDARDLTASSAHELWSRTLNWSLFMCVFMWGLFRNIRAPRGRRSEAIANFIYLLFSNNKEYIQRNSRIASQSSSSDSPSSSERSDAPRVGEAVD
jgi:hypothetical protein